MNKVIIFLDDERNIEDVFWYKYPEYKSCHIVRNFKQFKQIVDTILLYNKIELNDILFSFDHDLQDFNCDMSENTGYTCVKWLCDFIMENGYKPYDLDYVVHSQNPIGKKNIDSYIENFKKYA